MKQTQAVFGGTFIAVLTIAGLYEDVGHTWKLAICAAGLLFSAEEAEAWSSVAWLGDVARCMAWLSLLVATVSLFTFA